MTTQAPHPARVPWRTYVLTNLAIVARYAAAFVAVVVAMLVAGR